MDDGFRTRWSEVNEKLAQLWPNDGRVTKTNEHVWLEGRVVTRTLEVVVCEIDPIAELARFVDAAKDFELAIYDRGVMATAPGISICVHGVPSLGSYELYIDAETEHDDVDLRAELERHEPLAPLSAIVELGQFVNDVEHTEVTGRAPQAAFTVTLDEDSRQGLVAWLTAHEFLQQGGTWSRGDHGVMLGVDEATAFVRPPRRFAKGTDAEGLVFSDDIEVAPTQIVDEIAVGEPPAAC